MPRLKIITVCEGGNNRSHGLAKVLRVEFQQNAINIGMNHVFAEDHGGQPGNMLCQWADWIVVMSEKFKANVLHAMRGVPECRSKVRVCEVGDDVYGSGDHHDLVMQCREWCLAQGLKRP